MPNIYTIHGFKLGDTCYGGNNTQGLKTNISITNDCTDGSAYPRIVSVNSVKPELTIETTNIKNVMDDMGLLGELITAQNAVTIYAQQFVHGGMRATTGNKSFTSTNGIVNIESLSWTQGEDAKLNFKATMLPALNATTPFTVADVTTLPTLSAVERYGVKSVTFGSTTSGGTTTATAITGVTGVDINFGITLVEGRSDGDYYPTVIAIQECKPTITLKGNFNNWMSNALYGTESTGTIVFGKRSNAPSYEDGSDFTLSYRGVLNIDDMINGSGNTTATCSAVITCTYDGTNHPIVIGDFVSE